MSVTSSSIVWDFEAQGSLPLLHTPTNESTTVVVSSPKSKEDWSHVKLLDGSQILFLDKTNQDLFKRDSDSGTVKHYGPTPNLQVTLEALGKTFVITVNPETTTKHLKEAFEPLSSLETAKQKYFFQGAELPDNAVICKIDVGNKPIVLVPSISEVFSFFLVNLSSKSPQLMVNPKTTIGKLKQHILDKHITGTESMVHEEDMCVTYRGQTLNNQDTIDKCGIIQETLLYLVVSDNCLASTMTAPKSVDAQQNELHESFVTRIVANEEVLRMVKRVQKSMDSGLQPHLIEDCTGGTYLLKDSDDREIGVFKPVDEEPSAPENPKGIRGAQMKSFSPMKPGVPVGDGALREAICYLLDKDSFAGVPPTVILRVLHVKEGGSQMHLQIKSGSLQEFQDGCTSADECSPNRFSVSDVQRIAIFDIRVLNADRHAGNILVRQVGDKKRLIPIDHAYALPHYLVIEDIYHEWLSWPQVKQPFGPQEKDYILKLDAEKDTLLLMMTYSLSLEFLISLWIGTYLLKWGVAKGLNLFQIGSLLVPSDVSSQTSWKTTSRKERHDMKGLVVELDDDDGEIEMNIEEDEPVADQCDSQRGASIVQRAVVKAEAKMKKNFSYLFSKENINGVSKSSVGQIMVPFDEHMQPQSLSQNQVIIVLKRFTKWFLVYLEQMA